MHATMPSDAVGCCEVAVITVCIHARKLWAYRSLGHEEIWAHVELWASSDACKWDVCICRKCTVYLACSLSIAVATMYRVDGSGLQPLDDVYSYSTLDNTWQKQTTTGQGPSARNAAIACVVADNEMLLHGGWDPFRQTYSDSFILQCEATG